LPKRTDIHKILVIGAGPIVIGQACEFDYSGTQAAKSLREEGYEVVLVNSNPATIMTDPECADRTYIEPLTISSIAKILEQERPDALLPTVGGQTALNLAVKLSESGILRECGTRLIGARLETIRVAEDRRLFRSAMEAEGLDVPRSFVVSSVEDAVKQVEEIGYPVVVRPSFTLGGQGGGVAYHVEELRQAVARGIDASPVGEVLVEEGLMGWKEYELEVMRDARDRFVVICTIENLDPMGVHTGDSITVAPSMTLSDVEFQAMRDMARRVIRRVGVETGGSNIQFAVHPGTGRTVVIEMNPRVSRSSALASKATGFPIAKIAAKLAVGLALDEIQNDITRQTPACFEPSLDYVVVKIPRFNFQKFPGSADILDTQMRSVGEVMAIGRTFPQALQKALRSLENGRAGLGADGKDKFDPERILERVRVPRPDRIFWVYYALKSDMSVEDIHQASQIDRWFLYQIQGLVELERQIQVAARPLAEPILRTAKRAGYSDIQLAHLTGSTEDEIRVLRHALGVVPTYKTVDTCASEFEARTPYYYGTYEDEDEVSPSDRKKVLILGGGPNRIGQGIEFDCCCVHATQALREDGFETIMVNCNPETVSTDYDISDRLYFEPLTKEDVLEIVAREKPIGIIVQFGGATPLALSGPLSQAGVTILGTSPDAIDLAEDRGRFGKLLDRLGIARPDYGTASNLEEARAVARQIGYPVLVRPSYVLGGRAMAVCYDDSRLEEYLEQAVRASAGRAILIDRFLEDAFEVDVDALADGQDVVICGIMQHLEEAGIHSGDSVAVLPTWKVAQKHLETIRAHTRELAQALAVRGLMNVQYAIFEDKVYVLEVNPRASRTVPFLSKAHNIPFAKLAARIMTGKTLRELNLCAEPLMRGYAIKVPVFPYDRFPGFDPVPGPEMRSTGEAYGADADFGLAFAKGMMSAGHPLPIHGTVCLSVNDRDKDEVVPIARAFAELGFRLMATRGNAERLTREGLEVEMVYKVNEGRPNVADRIHNGEVDLMINTPLGGPSFYDECAFRRAAVEHRTLILTTLSAARAAVEGIRMLRKNVLTVNALQDKKPTG